LFRFTRSKLKTVAVFLVVVLLLCFVPQLYLLLRYHNQIATGTAQLPAEEYGIVFGATVNDDLTLADVTRERIEAAVLLYKQGKIRRIFVSGDNRHNRETDNIVAYAVQRGVSASHVISDPIGIDTGDTCRHFRQIALKAILLTQRFHLPRALLMCEQNGIQVVGLAVDELGLLSSRGDDAFQILFTRITRFVRESLLTDLHLLGIYNLLSNEAENIE
jgi:vancomycin permeability regulator SanA